MGLVWVHLELKKDVDFLRSQLQKGNYCRVVFGCCFTQFVHLVEEVCLAYMDGFRIFPNYSPFYLRLIEIILNIFGTYPRHLPGGNADLCFLPNFFVIYAVNGIVVDFVCTQVGSGLNSCHSLFKLYRVIDG